MEAASQLAVSNKQPAYRSRRRPDKIYDEWEKADGSYSVAYPLPLEHNANEFPPYQIRGKLTLPTSLILIIVNCPANEDPPLHPLFSLN
jgi:hypothetical protein